MDKTEIKTELIANVYIQPASVKSKLPGTIKQRDSCEIKLLKSRNPKRGWYGTIQTDEDA